MVILWTFWVCNNKCLSSDNQMNQLLKMLHTWVQLNINSLCSLLQFLCRYSFSYRPFSEYNEQKSILLQLQELSLIMQLSVFTVLGIKLSSIAIRQSDKNSQFRHFHTGSCQQPWLTAKLLLWRNSQNVSQFSNMHDFRSPDLLWFISNRDSPETEVHAVYNANTKKI